LRWQEFIGDVMQDGLDILEMANPFEPHAQTMGSELDTDDENTINQEVFSCCDKNCLATYGKIYQEEYRRRFLSLSKHDQRLILIGILSSCSHRKNSERLTFSYRFDGDHPICREAFRHIYGLGSHTLKALQSIVRAQEFTPPDHGNVGKESSRRFCGKPKETLDSFINNYIEIHGLPSPGRLRAGNVEINLPGDTSMASMWRQYTEALNVAKLEKFEVTYDFFRRYLNASYPQIQFQQARSDLCDFCDEIRSRLISDQTESKNSKLLREYKSHLDQVHAAREEYRKQIDFAKNSWEKLPIQQRSKTIAELSVHPRYRKNSPCRMESSMHYSFDFAQQIKYPYSPQQRGSEYFATARKCSVFGVVTEPIGRSTLFLLDEEEFCGKGADTVISYIDTFFSYHGLGENHALLHADNCTGQNKNNAMIWYLAWRVMAGLHQRISLSFMLTGHTKFAPDSAFGLFKLKYRSQQVDCLADLERTCYEAATENRIVPHFEGTHLGLSERFIDFYKWTLFLEKNFKKIPNISGYRYFQFDAKTPGVVGLKQNELSKIEYVSVLKNPHWRVHKGNLPAKLEAEGLSPERQEYLYRKIRRYVRDPKKREITCPCPQREENDN
jgi:hypothetical protein